MSLKMKLGKSAYDALPDDVKKEYKAEGSEFVLDLDGYEDPDTIKRAKDAEVAAHKETKKERDKHKTDLDKANTDLADAKRAAGGNETALATLREELTADFNSKLSEKDKSIEAFKETTIATHRDRVALDMATKISTVPSLLAPAIAKRISVTLDEKFAPSHFFLDPAGKQTASNAQDIEREFSTNAEYKGIIKGTGGSGGVRDPNSPGPGRAGKDHKAPIPRIGGAEGPPDLSKMSAQQLVEHRQAQQAADGA